MERPAFEPLDLCDSMGFIDCDQHTANATSSDAKEYLLNLLLAIAGVRRPAYQQGCTGGKGDDQAEQQGLDQILIYTLGGKIFHILLSFKGIAFEAYRCPVIGI